MVKDEGREVKAKHLRKNLEGYWQKLKQQVTEEVQTMGTIWSRNAVRKGASNLEGGRKTESKHHRDESPG